MKILLVCAGGMSISILLKKMKEYWNEQDVELDAKAVGLGTYNEEYQNYDIVLVGPQVAYRVKEIKEKTGLPTATIESFDYAIANCANIMKLSKKLYQM